ncbi:hypothetical protein Ancab_030261 [Ancistrocladus abbreviatus]
MDSEEGPIEKAAAEQRERLRALKAAQELHNSPDEDSQPQRELITTEEESIEQVPAEQRERLRDLKAAQELHNTPEDDLVQANGMTEDADADGEENSLNPKFRNYVPRDKQLQERKLAPPELPKFEDPVLAAPPPEKKEDPFLNIAPKKPNWDLRRDVQKKLDKLERRTQKALFKLMETWIHVNSEIREPKHSVWSTFWSGSGPNSDMK